VPQTYFSDYIESYDFVLGPPEVNRAALTLFTYNQYANFNNYEKYERSIPSREEIHRLLTKDGLDITIRRELLYMT